MGNLSGYFPEQSETVRCIYEWHEKMALAKEGPHRGRLGASIIGKPCERQLWYEFRNLGAKHFEGRILRLFETGHLEEPRFVNELRGIGCCVYEVDESTGQQFEFTALGGHFVCHPDAMALGVKEAPKTWHVCEFKTMGGTEDEKSKDFEKVQKDGVRKAKPEHYSQMMCGMGLAGVTRALYLAKKKATDHLHSERIRYNADEFNALMERARRIISSVHPPERLASRPDDFRCKFCDVSDVCWGTGGPAVCLPGGVSCRSCCHATAEIDEGESWARWSCARREHDLDLKCQSEACPNHILLPGFVLFAEPVDAGEDWIEFKNAEDGAVWRHGVGDGDYNTEELSVTPGPILGRQEVQDAKKVFGASVIKTVGLVERYTPGECKLMWKGEPAKMTDALADVLEEHGYPRDTQANAMCDDDEHFAAEFEGQLLAVLYKEHDCAAIWKGLPF